jgi:hypothetical protein
MTNVLTHSLPTGVVKDIIEVSTALGCEHLWAVCFPADECPNSADDSDDDVITDYLCEGTGPPMANRHGSPGPLVPTISVTPHSPGGKHYPVLGECNSHMPFTQCYAAYWTVDILYVTSCIICCLFVCLLLDLFSRTCSAQCIVRICKHVVSGLYPGWTSVGILLRIERVSRGQHDRSLRPHSLFSRPDCNRISYSVTCFWRCLRDDQVLIR